jgi:hypothetical protein
MNEDILSVDNTSAHCPRLSSIPELTKAHEATIARVYREFVFVKQWIACISLWLRATGGELLIDTKKIAAFL